MGLNLLLDYGYLSANELGSRPTDGAIHPHTSRATISAHIFFPFNFPSPSPRTYNTHATSRPVSGVCSTQFILSSCLQLPFVQSLPSPSSQSRLRLEIFPLRFPRRLSRKYCFYPVVETPLLQVAHHISPLCTPANNLRRPSTRLSYPL